MDELDISELFDNTEKGEVIKVFSGNPDLTQVAAYIKFQGYSHKKRQTGTRINGRECDFRSNFNARTPRAEKDLLLLWVNKHALF